MIAVPMTEPSSQDSGLASKTLARQAFWIVVSREGSAIGRATFVFAMPATPRPCEVTLTIRLAPFSLLVLASVSASKIGWNGSFEQFASWKGEDTLWLPPSSPVSVPSIFSGLQLVGLNWKFGRSTTTCRCLTCAGAPVSSVGWPPAFGFVFTIVGTALPISAWAVYGLTLSVERVTTLPKWKGPASAGMTTLRPRGAPPYAPVRYTRPV